MSSELERLVKKAGDSLGMDDDDSSSLIAGLNNTIAPMCMLGDLEGDDLEADDHVGICFKVDASGSMSGIKDDVIECFNDIIIPALLEGAKDEIGSIHICGFAFSENVYPLWGGGWHSLTEKMPKLELSEYWGSGAGSMTALHEAALTGIASGLAYSGKIISEKGISPTIVLPIISDGRNNLPPHNADEVNSKVIGLDSEMVTLPFFGFPPAGAEKKLEDNAKAMGWRDIMMSAPQPGESDADRKRRFRHSMGVFSSSLVGRVSGNIVAQPDDSGGSTFWPKDSA